MFGIDRKVGAVRVRRSLDDARPTINHTFVVAEIELANRGDAAVTVGSVPAVFVAADGTEFPSVDASRWDTTVEVGPYATARTYVVFEVPRMKAAGGAVRIVRDAGPEGQHLHLAS